jgi:dynein heavy chain
MGALVKGSFDEYSDYVMQSPVLFGDFMTANPTDETFIDPRLYEDCGGYEAVKKKFDWLLQEYNYD